jgi:hypothetical protein
MIQDYFVGFVAAACGCLLVIGAALDAVWLMGLRRPRLLVESLGKSRARWTLGLIGVCLIAVGGVIASGWRLNWSWVLGTPQPQTHQPLLNPESRTLNPS